MLFILMIICSHTFGLLIYIKQHATCFCANLVLQNIDSLLQNIGRMQCLCSESNSMPRAWSFSKPVSVTGGQFHKQHADFSLGRFTEYKGIKEHQVGTLLGIFVRAL